jgi:hypothetical protein
VELLVIFSLAAEALAAIFLRGDLVKHSIRVGGAREVECAVRDHNRIGPRGVSALNPGQEMLMLAEMSAGQFCSRGRFSHILPVSL